MGQVSKAAAAKKYNLESVANFSPLYRLMMSLFLLVYAPLCVGFNYLWFGVRFEGREHLSRGREGACILVSNHSLYLDPAVIIHALFPRRAYYTGLKSHFAVPVGGAILRLMGGIPIPDVRGMRTAERTVGKALELGHHVHVFPEGEMTHMSQEIAPFQKGAFFLAIRLGVPIIPMTLAHRPRRFFGKELSPRLLQVRCVIGAPIDSARMNGERLRDASDRLTKLVHEQMTQTISAAHQTP